MSLSTALVLLRQDGSHSLDALRRDRRHQHHGLVLSRGSLQTNRPASSTKEFLTAVKCDLKIKNDVPWGLFGLFYNSLVPCCVASKVDIRDKGKSTYLSSHSVHPCIDMVEITALVGNTFNTLELIKSLPDTYFILHDMGIETYLCRGSMKQSATRHYKSDDKGTKQHEKTVETTDYFVDGILAKDKESLISSCTSQNPNIELAADLGEHIHLRHTVEAAPPDIRPYFMPDMVDDVSGQLFYLIPTGTYLPEPASHFILSYCLGMLSRYFPDLWMTAIDENVQIAELIDSLLSIVARKFPNLILDQMTEVKHHVHI